MIGKIAPNGKGARGLASYLLRRGRGRIIAGTMAGLNPRELSREFGALRRLNPKLTKAVAHLMLSPAPGDPPLSDAQWQGIAQRYAEGMGYADTAWCGVIHNDTDHQHLHIIACRIDLCGKTISDANSYRKSEAIVRRLEADFGLIAVASPSGKKGSSRAKPITTNQGDITMTETPSIQPNPFDPDDPQHVTWPEPFEPGRDLAELAIVNTTPTIQVPGISAADFLSEAERRNMRRKLVEDDYEQRMLGTLGGDLTRIYRHAHGSVLYFKQPGRIADQGDRLTVLGGMDEKLAARRLVALGRERGWKTISFTGSGSFLELAMREALNEHLTVIAQDARQQVILDKVLAERQGSMGTVAGPSPLPPGAVAGGEDILAPLDELDDLPPPPWSKPTKPESPTQPVAAPPAAPAKPMAPKAPSNEPPKAPPVGVVPMFRNLRERLQDRREQKAPRTPGPSPTQPGKRPGPSRP
jgi:hypothetical protein